MPTYRTNGNPHRCTRCQRPVHVLGPLELNRPGGIFVEHDEDDSDADDACAFTDANDRNP